MNLYCDGPTYNSMFLKSEQGFYGHGSLSKHEPIFHKVVEHPVESIEHHLKSISRERYL